MYKPRYLTALGLSMKGPLILTIWFDKLKSRKSDLVGLITIQLNKH